MNDTWKVVRLNGQDALLYKLVKVGDTRQRKIAVGSYKFCTKRAMELEAEGKL